MIRTASLLLLSLVLLSGCGKAARLTGASAPEARVAIKSEADVLAEENTFWKDYPTQVTWVTIKSQKTDYMVVRLTARKLGFNQGAKLSFPVKVKDRTQFTSSLFLGKDKKVYVSELGSRAGVDFHFYCIGSFGARSLELAEGDPVRLRLDPGFTLNAEVETAKGQTPDLLASLDFKAMPNVLSAVRLFTRESK